MVQESKRFSIIDWDGEDKLVDIVESTATPGVFGIVAVWPTGSPIGGWGGATPNQLLKWQAGQLQAIEADFAPLEVVDIGTVILSVAAYDDTTEEFRNGTFQVPTDIDSSGTVTFRAMTFPKTAAASVNVEMRFGHRAVDDGEALDGSYTTEDSGDVVPDSTQDDLTVIEWTETVANLGWVAEDLILFQLSRIAPAGTDLTGDLYLIDFAIDIPQA